MEILTIFLLAVIAWLFLFFLKGLWQAWVQFVNYLAARDEIKRTYLGAHRLMNDAYKRHHRGRQRDDFEDF